MGQEHSSNGKKRGVVNSQNSTGGTPGQLVMWLSALTVLPCCRQGPEREPTHQRPLLCVTHPTVTVCLLFAPPLPLFNCWMSLQSCVPKTINSREQSYTEKGVSPEGDGYPWKPPPFHSSLGKARGRGAVWAWAHKLHPEQGPAKCWGH